jgi:hypothetical protein
MIWVIFRLCGQSAVGRKFAITGAVQSDGVGFPSQGEIEVIRIEEKVI